MTIDDNTKNYVDDMVAKTFQQKTQKGRKPMKEVTYVVLDKEGDIVVEFFISRNTVALVRKGPGVRVLVAEDMNKVIIPNENGPEGG